MIEVMGHLRPIDHRVHRGDVPGIKGSTEARGRCGLAVSLHAADDELRTSLVPINERYPLAESWRRRQHAYFDKKGRRLSSSGP